MQLSAQDELVLIKGKRSKRPRLQLTMATSSSTTPEFSSGGVISTDSNISGSSNSSHHRDEEEHDMANCLILLAKGRQTHAPPYTAGASTDKAEVIYQCKTCNKSFHSFQALGGHRASHKKPVIKPEEKKVARDYVNYNNNNNNNNNNNSRDEDESTILSLQIPSRISGNYKTRVHECSICGAGFGSGQALGGHMRRHRPMPRVAPACSVDGGDQESKRQKNLLSLDLNLPAPEDNDLRESKFPFASKEQVIVFSATVPLLDCHIY